MKDGNTRTIETYNKSVDKYVSATSFQVVWSYIQDWITQTLSYISKDDKILEIGSWWWRDADYFEEQWYQVQRSDYADWFIEYIQKQGKHILKVNILDIQLPEKYKLVFADAVLLHLSEEQMKIALQQVYNVLEEWGYFSFSLQNGVWEELRWASSKSNGDRYFKYRDVDSLVGILKEYGFNTVYTSKDKSDKWIRIICQK